MLITEAVSIEISVCFMLVLTTEVQWAYCT